jgi:hypothetical protein
MSSSTTTTIPGPAFAAFEARDPESLIALYAGRDALAIGTDVLHHDGGDWGIVHSHGSIHQGS